MKLSVITICYNNLIGLERTYQSVVNQTARKEFEWIVLDGASTDGTYNWLREHDREIDIWISEPDSGIYNAMNKGIRRASGDYCLFINSGDLISDCDIISQCLPLLDGTIIIYGNLITIDPKTNKIRVNKYPHKLKASYFINGTLPHQSSFIFTAELRKNPYSEKYKIVSDWLFFIKEIILFGANYKFINKCVGVFYLDGISVINYNDSIEECKLAWSENIPEAITEDVYDIIHARRFPFYSFFRKLTDIYRTNRTNIIKIVGIK